MDATVEAVKILQELPNQLGELRWKPGAEVGLGVRAAHAVRKIPPPLGGRKVRTRPSAH